MLDRRAKELEARVRRGSAEHVTYYVLQSRTFTDAPPIDPVRLAASRPDLPPENARRRFREFESAPPRDARHRIVSALFRSTGWTLEECFRETMAFLRAAAPRESRDAVYQTRGLSMDSAPSHTEALRRAADHLTEPILLVGPGLDLTRREGFTDDLPLKSHQAEWIRMRAPALECMDARPEVVEFLRGEGACAFGGDIAGDVPRRGFYGSSIATNVLLYLDDAGLFLAMASIAAALRSGGCFIHNDSRFAVKVFGEALGLPVIRFESVELGARNGVAQMDRVAVHRKEPK
jgi:hypothetical protein